MTAKRASRVARAITLCAVAASCGGGEGRRRLVYVDALPVLPLVEEFRIGSVDDLPEGFSFIGTVVVGPAGRIHVSELMQNHIRVYTPDGRLERVIGGTGAGPGEFRAIGSMGLIADTLWVADPANGRITFFTAVGQVIRTMRAQPVAVDAGFGRPILIWPMIPRPDGRWEGAVAMDGGPDSLVLSYPNLVFDETGAVVDTLGVRSVQVPPFRVRAGDVSIRSEHALAAWPLVRWSGGDTVVVRRPVAGSNREATFGVARIDASGDTVFRVEFRYRPSPVDDEYVAWVVGQMPRTPGQSIGADQLERALRSVLPTFHPPVSQVRPGEDGSTWLRREHRGGETSRWLVIGRDGEALGHVDLPRSARIAWTGGERIIVIEQDQLNVPWLVRYRLRGIRTVARGPAVPAR